MTESFNSLANESAITPATVRPGHGYPADRVETSPEPTGWQGSGAANALEQAAPIGILGQKQSRSKSDD